MSELYAYLFGSFNALITPPGVFVLLLLLGLALAWRWRRFGLAWLGVVLALFWLCATPRFNAWLARQFFETMTPIALPLVQPTSVAGSSPVPQAVVVLGGGRQTGAREYTSGTSFPPNVAVLRLHYGIMLARALSLPVLFTGGAPDAGLGASETTTLSEAEVASAFAAAWGYPLRWADTQSRNTLENATRTRALLDAHGIERIYLVTDVRHMHRALVYFRCAGIQVTPAPMGYQGSSLPHLLSNWLPSSEALQSNHAMAHEALGLLYQRWVEGLWLDPVSHACHTNSP